MRFLKKSEGLVLSKVEGFTLVELLVVLAIIGILVALSVVGYGIAQRITRDTARKTDLGNIEIALQDYHEKNRKYPTSITEGTNEVTVGTETVPMESDGAVQFVSGCPEGLDSISTSADDLHLCYTATNQTYTIGVRLENGTTESRSS